MRKYNNNASIIQAIENLYNKAKSAVLFNGSTGDWVRTTDWVWQECLLSLTLFNIYLEGIMSDALEGRKGSVGIGGRIFNNFRFADDIVVNAEQEEKAYDTVTSMDTAYCKVQYGDWTWQDKNIYKQPR